ncbi:MAG: hypothetical protein WBM98_17495 [Maribacter sp.]|uniref:hypothetical protein n=1 Tax=Maribacter sp. TaxID=1897614 RepID=UPI003C750E5E
MKLKNHIHIALGYFIVAAFLGVLLRSFYSFEIPINYKFIVHGHSHIALLGWVYMALTTLLYTLFLAHKDLVLKYRRIFWFTQITLMGMLVTFPFQGYALFSIIFSTLFLFASYWFFWFFRKYARPEIKKSGSYQCINAALWYMVISSLGPWVLGAVMKTLGAESIWYRLAIYFYLHFQYNGWMILALLGLLLYVFERQGIATPKRMFQRFFLSMNGGIILTYSLSTLWLRPSAIFYLLGGIGALLQLLALIVLIRFIKDHLNDSGFTGFQLKILKIGASLLFLKMGLQIVSSVPYFANLASTILDFAIGYLHLTFLGVVTLGLFLFLDFFGLLKIPKTSLRLYVIGFVFTEGLIFYKGIAAWLHFGIFKGYFEGLALGSFLILISLVTMFRRQRG